MRRRSIGTVLKRVRLYGKAGSHVRSRYNLLRMKRANRMTSRLFRSLGRDLLDELPKGLRILARAR